MHRLWCQYRNYLDGSKCTCRNPKWFIQWFIAAINRKTK